MEILADGVTLNEAVSYNDAVLHLSWRVLPPVSLAAACSLAVKFIQVGKPQGSLTMSSMQLLILIAQLDSKHVRIQADPVSKEYCKTFL